MNEVREVPELGQLLSGIRKLFVPKETSEVRLPGQGSHFDSIRDEYNATLKSLQERLAAERAALERLRAQSTATQSSGTAAFKISKNEIAQAHSEIRSDIEDLHVKLGSGIDVSTLPDLREFMLSSAKEIRIGSDGDIECRIRSAGLISILERSADIAWRKLLRLMKVAGIRWPEPHNLAPNASDEQRERARAREVADIQETFLHAKPEAVGELVIGVVHSWKFSYPARGSWLWQQVALRAVASAVEARIAKQAVEELKAQGDAIREEVASLLRNEIRSLSKIMASGGAAIDEIDSMAQNTSALITKIVVDKMMMRAQPVFQEAEA